MEYVTQEIADDIVELAVKINEAGLSGGIALTAKSLTPFPEGFTIKSGYEITREVGCVVITISVLPF